MESISAALRRIDEKKKKLDSAQPLPPALEKNLQEWLTVNFIYETNVLEGNSLSHSETAIVIEKGIAIGGKTSQEHIELIDCARAMKFITTRARNKQGISVDDILTIHKIVSDKNDPSLDLVDFMQWLHSVTDHPIIAAALAHYKLVAATKEGRFARLLMNLLLLQYGYPFAIIQKEQRSAYIDAIEHVSARPEPVEGDDFDQFYAVIITAVEYSLDIYLDAVEQSNLL
jgi:Fic family protein